MLLPGKLQKLNHKTCLCTATTRTSMCPSDTVSNDGLVTKASLSLAKFDVFKYSVYVTHVSS